MKTIILRTEKSSRWAAMLLATVVAIITSAVVANATQTITTPNAVKITYNLAVGANSAAITPATNTSVQVMGCCTTDPDQGVGQVSLVHIPSTTMGWAGMDSPTSGAGGASITSGFGAMVGAHIVYIDMDHAVDIQMASADTIHVHNGDFAPRAGNVTLIW
jgi:hypothetical protein